MKWTNTRGAPQPLYDAVVGDGYSMGDADISVTQLIDSPRVRVLKKKHDHEIVKDISTEIQSLLGKGLHAILESAAKNSIAERRLSVDVLGWKLSGGMDLYDEIIALDKAILTDYKSTNVWKMVYATKGVVDSFEKQLNVYAYILRENKINVTELKICTLFKDWKEKEFTQFKSRGKIWSPNKASGYPEEHFSYFNVKMWTQEKAKKYVNERIILHQKAEQELPLCSSEDVWHGNRCRRYCDISPWCTQYQKSKTTGLLGG